MAEDPKEDGEELYKVQTVPPPAGETDAYNAPTRVGPMASAVIGEIIEHAKRKGGVVEVLGDIREPASQPKEIRKPPPKPSKSGAPAGSDEIPESQPIQPMAVINVASESTPDAVSSAPNEVPSFPPPMNLKSAPPPAEEIKTPPIMVSDVAKALATGLDPDALAAQANTPMPMPTAPLAAPPSSGLPAPITPSASPSPPSEGQPQPQPMVAAAPAPAEPSRVRLIVLLAILCALIVAGAMLFIRK